MTTFLTLSEKQLSELPQIPTDLSVTGDTSTINAEWVNNNTNVTGTTNQTQTFSGGTWSDNVNVASSETTATLTGTTTIGDINVRVGVKVDNRIYSSRVKTANIFALPFPTDGLIGRWQFEGDLTDSHNSYDLSTTFVNYIDYRTGLVGDSVYNTGSGDAALYTTDSAVKAVFAGTNNYTWAGWFRSGGASIMRYFTMSESPYDDGSQSNDFMGVVMNNDNYQLCNRAGTGFSELILRTIEINTWYHFMMIFNGTDTKFYINNVLGLTHTESTSITPKDNILPLADKNTRYYDAELDQLYLYNREINSTERAQLYNSGAGV